MRVLIVVEDASLATATAMALRVAWPDIEAIFERADGSVWGFPGDARLDLAIVDAEQDERPQSSVDGNLSFGGVVPILWMLTERSLRQRALLRGAFVADFIVKPFSYEELIARVARLVLGGSVIAGGDSVPYSDDYLTIDPRTRQVFVAGSAVRLTNTEFELLAGLVRGQGKILATEELARHLWGSEPLTPSSRKNVEWHMVNLRRKLQVQSSFPPVIQNVRGVGYIYSPRQVSHSDTRNSIEFRRAGLAAAEGWESESVATVGTRRPAL